MLNQINFILSKTW